VGDSLPKPTEVSKWALLSQVAGMILSLEPPILKTIDLKMFYRKPDEGTLIHRCLPIQPVVEFLSISNKRLQRYYTRKMAKADAPTKIPLYSHVADNAKRMVMEEDQYYIASVWSNPFLRRIVASHYRTGPAGEKPTQCYLFLNSKRRYADYSRH
jgi:hypothetical protein